MSVCYVYCDGAPTLESTIEDIIAANVDDEDLVEGLRALKPGETYYGGGGAAPEFRIVRIDEARLLRPISALALHPRTERILERHGLRTIADIVALTRSELYQVPRCGRLTIREIREALADEGLGLARER